VLRSNITESTVTVDLALTNATTWTDSGVLDITSSEAGVIWALGKFPPSDPANPDSDFLEHEFQGTFTIDMAAAQTVSGRTGNSTGNSSSAGPLITGAGNQVSFPGITARQKVQSPPLFLIRPIPLPLF